MELRRINNLNSDLLSIGQKLIINDTATMSDNETRYIVKPNDSLYSIARMYGITVEDIRMANNLMSDLLTIGQVLIIPDKGSQTIYTVKKGDNLYSIAREYGTTVSEIKRLNNLSTDFLSIGQKLILP